MLVGCKFCKKKINRDFAYVHVHETPKTKVKWYFCNEDEFNQYENKKTKKVKCAYCGKEILPNEAYVIAGKHYCNEEEYKEYINITNLKHKVSELLSSFMGNKVSYSIQNRVMADVFSNYDLHKLYSFLTVKKQDIERSMWKIIYNSDSPSYNAYRYLRAIIVNEIDNYKMPKQEVVSPVISQNEVIVSKYKRRKSRRAYGEL